MKLKCTVCQAETTLSLVKSSYEGPYRCWNCHTLFAIKLKDNKLIRYKYLSEEEFKKQQEMKVEQDKLERQFPGR